MLQKYKTKREEGFTIIEVLIVLAIAGLIILIVFLAVPALQRNARNNARNNDAARISGAITECLSNRNGVKTSCDEASEINVGNLNQLTLPAGPYSDSSTTDIPAGTTAEVAIGFQRKCTQPGDNDEAGTVREFAVLYQQEPAINRCVGN